MGVSYYEQWDLDLREAEKRIVPGALIKLRRKLVFMALGSAVELSPGKFTRLSGVVLLTPVDTGRARASWNVSVGPRPSTSTPPPGKYRRPAMIRRATAALSSAGKFDSVWITSSLPYITVLEYGGYPDPPKAGSWVKKTRKYIVKSAGGYSKQAPRGMVRVTFGSIMNALKGG